MSESTSHHTVETLALVGVGGFGGAIVRYVAGQFVAGPAGTMLVNTVGSFALGVLVYEAVHLGRLSSAARLTATTGFLSSFTTYSTFAVETAGLAPAWALANVAGSYALGLAGVLAGRTLVRRTGRRGG